MFFLLIGITNEQQAIEKNLKAAFAEMSNSTKPPIS
jgi:hypothetical protein